MAKSNWYYDTNGQTTGPVTVRQLRQLAASGQLQPTDRVRKEDMDRWVKAQAVKGLFGPPMISNKSEPGGVPGAESAEGDTVFDFLGNAATADADDDEEFRPEFDFFGGAPSAPVAPRKSAPPHKSKPENEQPATPSPSRPPLPPNLKRPSAAADAPIRMADPIVVEPPPDDVPTAEVVVEEEEEVSFALADEVPMASPVTGEFGARPDLSGPEVVLKPDGGVKSTGAMLALSLNHGWLTARASTPDGSEHETYMRLGQIDAVAYRVREGSGGSEGESKVLSFHAGAQIVALICPADQDGIARAFVQLVIAGV